MVKNEIFCAVPEMSTDMLEVALPSCGISSTIDGPPMSRLASKNPYPAIRSTARIKISLLILLRRTGEDLQRLGRGSRVA